ncbi:MULTISPECIES: hypothetical protein [unclassified Streptomyces]|uniref:hypothetical protein n=1 Tax=unclassified Streptomyces TaxID=2593676 RepID=UPI0033A545B6
MTAALDRARALLNTPPPDPVPGQTEFPAATDHLEPLMPDTTPDRPAEVLRAAVAAAIRAESSRVDDLVLTDAVLSVLPAPALAVARQLLGTTTCPECGNTGACNGGPCPLLTADEAREMADDLNTDLYKAQDALAFVGECCDIADRNQRPITTGDVRKWLKGARCGRQLLGTSTGEDTADEECGDQLTEWTCTLPPGPHPNWRHVDSNAGAWWDQSRIAPHSNRPAAAPPADRRERYAAAMALRDGHPEWPVRYEDDERDYRRRADAVMAVADAEQASLRAEAEGLDEALRGAISASEKDGARLRAEMATAAPPAPADRAATRDRLRQAICEASGFDWDPDVLEPDEYGEHADAVLAVLAGEAAAGAHQTTEGEARPAEHSWAAELHDPLADEWVPFGSSNVRATAVHSLERGRRLAPVWADGTPTERRLVRATTTYTVEPTPAVPAAPEETR